MDRLEILQAEKRIAGYWLNAKRTYYRTDEFDREKRQQLRERFVAYADALIALVSNRADNTVAETYTHDGRIALDVAGTVYTLDGYGVCYVYRR